MKATGPGAREGILCLNLCRLKEQEVKIVFFRIQYSKKKWRSQWVNIDIMVRASEDKKNSPLAQSSCFKEDIWGCTESQFPWQGRHMGGRAACSGSPGVYSAELGNLACTFYPVTSWPPPSMTPASVSGVVSCLSFLLSCRSLRHREYSHAEGTQSPWGTFFSKIISSENNVAATYSCSLVL